MRIACLGLSLSGLKSGAHLSHLELAGRFEERGHEVRFAAIKGDPVTRFGQPVKVGTKAVAEAVRWADFVMVRDEPSVGRLLTYLHSRPSLYTCHSPAGDPRELKVTLPKGCTLVWVAENLKAECEERLGRFAGPNVVIHGLPIDFGRVRTERGGSVTLVNLSLRKGGSLFWQLAERLPDVSFLGVRGGWGHPVEHAPLPNVRIIESHPDPRAVYSQTAIILLPSAEPGAVSDPRSKLPAWGEAWNRVGIEAAASGIPALASPVAGIRASLKNAAVYLDPCYPEPWADWIRRLLSDPFTYGVRSRIALEQARAVESENSTKVEKYEALILAAVGKSSAGAVAV